MAYDYSTRRWRKLYLQESTQDRLFPLLMRGLRDHLIRHAKDDGTLLTDTENPATDLARALGAHPAETEFVEAHVSALLKDHYLSHRKGRLWITNLVAAQESKSPGAKRQKRYRQKKNGAEKHDAQETPKERNDGVTMQDVSDVTEASPVTSHKREERERREESPPTPSDSEQTEPRTDPFMRSLSGARKQDDPGVVTVFEAWKLAHDFRSAKFRQPSDFRADVLFEAVQTHGVENCLRVLEASKTDPKVLGKTDEQGEEHRSVEYLFKPSTFDRLLRAADQAAPREERSASDRMQRLKGFK